MILIISKRSAEITTERVMDWLYHFQVPFTRINGEDVLERPDFFQEISNDSVSIDTKYKGKLPFAEISVAWFRRWSDFEFLQRYVDQETAQTNIPYELLENLAKDQMVIRNYLFTKFSDKPFISNPKKTYGLNKLIMLSIAEKAGFAVPETVVCNSKSQLLGFLEKKQKVITKDIENSAFLQLDNRMYINYTSKISASEVDHIPETFALSAFQELLEKEYELRVFYFFGECFSMAIFSQNDDQTSVDFRNYNYKKPNRNVPHKLPEEVANKIVTLMNLLNLDTGSIDIVFTKKGQYVFLEVNPVGQLGMVSRPCNYNLESIIAQKLASYENKCRN